MSTIQETKPRKASMYAITEKKKAELDALALSVLDAQHEVDQYQAIVSSLTEKQSNFQAFLAVADNNRTQALNNKNMMEQLVQSTLDLKNNSDIAFNEMVLADSKTKDLAIQVKVVMDKLIYVAEMINKLANFIVRKKAMNPLILDDLVKMISTAGTNANNAVALTLVALKSSFAAQASNIESEAATALEYTQAMSLYQVLTGKDAKGDGKAENKTSIKALLLQAYDNAKTNYSKLQIANKSVTNQLNEATANLEKARISLNSLQSGLLAGNAAALAS